MSAEELTVVGGLQKREARGGKKKPEDSAFVPITANPFSCRESGDPLLARSNSTELCKKESLAPTHPPPTEGKVKNFHLSFVFAFHQPFQKKMRHFSGLEIC